jgi:hypothetical protein
MTNPVLLILDGHSTHTQNLDLVIMARANGVHILCLPPQSTHRLQPLDVSFMKPLSLSYDDNVRSWLRNHPGQLVTMFQIGAIFGNAYVRAATMQTAISGFRATGICPFDRNLFQDSDFAGSEVTEHSAPRDQSSDQAGVPAESSSQSASGQTTPSSGQAVHQAGPSCEVPGPSSEQAQPEAGPSYDRTESSSEQTGLPQAGTSYEPCDLPGPSSSGQPESSEKVSQTATPSSSNRSITRKEITSPADVMPLPCASVKTFYRKHAGATAILTSSPYQKNLKEKLHPKNKKSIGKGKRTASDTQAKKASEPTGTKRKAVKRNLAPSLDADIEKNDAKNTCSSKIKGKMLAAKKISKLKNKQESSDDSETENWPCLVCAESFCDSKSKEKWVQCIHCKHWAHLLCTPLEKTSLCYVCDNCNSDNDD